MTFLLDTNAWIEILNKPKGKVAIELAQHLPNEIALCSVVLGELLVGVYKSSQQNANLILVQQLVQQFACLPYDEAAADYFAQIRSFLEAQGTPIGPYDSQIAGIALANGLKLVIGNVSEFSRVPGLRVENWQ
jgi:tRNA(fMet)-specific endonuclease VapC